MFTGLVEMQGEVSEISHAADYARVTIRSSIAKQTRIGDSIAVNGVCLTVVERSRREFSFDVMMQTLQLSNLGELKIGSRVNLERAALVSDRLGGHIVQGHVDGIGRVQQIIPGAQWVEFVVSIPEHLLKYVQNQGSITFNGVSLTVGEVDDVEQRVTVWLIPETLKVTNLSQLEVGASVNIEVDVLAKYVERILERSQK